jgi:AcrR family transcriptional regulator
MVRPRTSDKRRRILDAAVSVFARKGYFAARVSDVAKRAGVADGTIYLYFRGKEDILVRLFDEVMSEHVAKASEAVRALPSAPQRLLAIAERHLAVLGDNRDLAAVFQVELRQSTRFMERFTASWLRDYFELLDEVMERAAGRHPARRREPEAGQDALRGPRRDRHLLAPLGEAVPAEGPGGARRGPLPAWGGGARRGLPPPPGPGRGRVGALRQVTS